MNLPNVTTEPFSWDAPDFGGHVHVAAWAPDAHDESEARDE